MSTIGLAEQENAFKAILVVVYETIAIFAFIYYLEHSKKATVKKKDYVNKRRTVFPIITFALLIISIASIALVPSLRDNYYSIFTEGFNTGVEIDISYREGTLLRILGTAGGMSLEIVRFILPCYLMYKLAKKKSFFRFLISTLLILVQVFFMTDNNAYILMLMVSQWIFLTRLYPNYQKRANILLIILIVVLLILMYQFRFSNTFYKNSFSMFLQAYIPGLTNTAGVFNVENDSFIFQLFTDVYCALPFKSFLGLPSLHSYADLWKISNNGEAQIASMVSQSIYYFSVLGAPILSCFFVWLSKRINNRIDTSNVMMSAAFTYLLIFTAAAPFIYNNCIFLQNFMYRIGFILLICKSYSS